MTLKKQRLNDGMMVCEPDDQGSRLSTASAVEGWKAIPVDNLGEAITLIQ